MSVPSEGGHVPVPGRLMTHPGMDAARLAVLAAIIRAAGEDLRRDGTCDPARVWLRETSGSAPETAISAIGWLVEVGAIDTIPYQASCTGRRFWLLWHQTPLPPREPMPTNAGPPPYAGWRVRYWTCDPTPGYPRRCECSLRAALPGAEVVVEEDPDAEALAITPPPGSSAREVNHATWLVREVVDRVGRGLL